MPAVEARNLLRVYPTGSGNVAALRGLDMSAGPGEVVAVLGSSGSGKSTLVRILAGLDRPTAGNVMSRGVALERASRTDLARYRSEVALVDQQYWRSLSPYLTAQRSIELPLELRGWRLAERATRALELLERVGLADRAAARPGQLSGGEQQRIALASAIAPRPALLLADEPTAELDETTAAGFLALLRTLVRQDGTTAIVVTHDRLIERVADRIVYVRDGRAIAVRRHGMESSAEPVVDASGWVAPPLPPTVDALARLEPGIGTTPAVVLDGVSRSYGTGPNAVSALRDVSATFAEGGLHIVTGPSGSGKSTLLRLVVGVDRPDAGTVVTLGNDLLLLDRTELARLRSRDVAFCPQAPRLVPFLNALENVELGLAVRGIVDAPSRADQAREALEAVGLADLASSRPDQLSGGQVARVAIARAIVGRPRLLVLDEPTAALDQASAASLIELLARLDRAAVTMLVATHDRDLIAAASDRLDLRDTRRA